MKQMELIKLDQETVKPDHYITKANALVEARYRLSLTEQRIVFLMASKVQPEDEDFKQYRLYVKDFTNMLDIKRPNLYLQMVLMIRSLMERVVTIRIGNEEYIDIHWVDKQRYGVGLGYAEVVFSPELKPFFLNLKERFTTYRLENVMRLKSIYSIRIYEILKQYQGPGKRTITIEKLREMLGIRPEEYKLYGHFKSKVIKVAHREINEKTDISFSYKEIKQGRKVHELEFTIEQKAQEKPDKAARQQEKDRKRQAREEKQKAAHREKVERYLSQLTKKELAELEQEAEQRARTEGAALYRGKKKVPEHVIRGYIMELAGEKIS